MSRRTIANLISELRSLSGLVHNTANEDVDWYVKKDNIEKKGLDSLIKEASGSIQGARKETLTGLINGLAERFGGLVSLLDSANAQTLATALEKIIEDSQKLLDDIQEGKKKPIEPKPKDDSKKDKQDVQAEPEKKEPDQKEPAQQKPAEKELDKKQEDTVFIAGETIANIKDPFGMGQSFMEEIMIHSGIRKR